MSALSKIEWTDRTWNPVRGCSLVSAGCKNCYAMKQAHRFSGQGQPYMGLTKMTSHGPVWTGTVALVEPALNEPAHWKKPARVFVNSMSDLFHDNVTDDFIAQVWKRMAWNQRHTFQVLTKRPARMLDWLSQHGTDSVFFGEEAEYQESLESHGWPVRNVWLGVSVEDQETARERIPILLHTPAAVRWLSCEPLLGPIDLSPWLELGGLDTDRGLSNPGIDWVVCGGESGPGARPMHPEWARSLRDQCKAAGVPFFFKQWGDWGDGDSIESTGLAKHGWWEDDRLDGGATRHEWPGPTINGIEICSQRPTVYHVGKKAAGRFLDGITHDAYPQPKQAL